MPTCLVDGLRFAFPNDWTVSKYDNWSFYQNRYIKIADGIKALDLLAVSPSKVAWLVEVKDYRANTRTKPSDLAGEIVKKVHDTLAAILPAKLNGNEALETAVSQAVAKAVTLRVVLHLEQPAKHSKLFPRAIDPTVVQMKLRQHLKPIDAHPRVAEMANMRTLEWTVS